jgi:hypothetical protein
MNKKYTLLRYREKYKSKSLVTTEKIILPKKFRFKKEDLLVVRIMRKEK